jgi:DNA-binding transcriptional regulator YiaG
MKRTPQALQTWRKSRGLRQVDFAQMLEISDRTVIRWERGDVAIPPYLWKLLDRLLPQDIVQAGGSIDTN